MKLVLFCKTISLLAVLFLTGFSVRSQGTKKPNIIIILADDMGWGDVGYHGSKIKTPNIDKFVKEGIELNRFYTATVCSPTRAGILTGRYPDRYGLRTVIPPWSTFGIDTAEVFLPQALAMAGYQNRAIVGKWHLGHASVKYHPLSRGFTHFYGFLNGNLDYFTHQREGELDWHNDWQPNYDQGYSTDLIADEAIKDIKTYSKGSPFFLYLTFNAPHSPLQAKKEDLHAYGYDESKPSFQKAGKEGMQGRGNTREQTYAAMVSNLDHNIGRVLQTLKDLKIEDNTVVLFQSDNGAEENEAGSSGQLKGKKGTEWEGGVRAPAAIRWPAAFKSGIASNQVMGYVDVMPTLLEIAGVKSKPKKPFDGISMLPVLTGKVASIDRNFYLGNGAIVNQNWKLIDASKASANMGITEDMLFHISTDSTETTNVKMQYSKEFEALRKALQPYDIIRPSMQAPGYNVGRKGFVAPKEWTITEK